MPTDEFELLSALLVQFHHPVVLDEVQRQSSVVIDGGQGEGVEGRSRNSSTS